MLVTPGESVDEPDIDFLLWTPSNGHMVEQQLQGAVKKTYPEPWPIGTNNERELKEPVLSARLHVCNNDQRS